MQTFVLALGALLSTAIGHVDAVSSKPLQLTVLKSGCSLRSEWVGQTAERVLLRCVPTDFLVVEPSNMFGHVAINTSDAALAFVRFFSSPDSYRWFSLDGMVEVVPGRVSDTSNFNIVDPHTFEEQHLTKASSREITARSDKNKVFEIKRTVVIGPKICEITETVTQQGLYTIVSKRELMDAGKLGVFHLGDV